MSTRSAPQADFDAPGLEAVDASTLTRAMYSSDASIYRLVPQGVARPRDREELLAVARAALSAGIPITMRGAGTSCAGNAIGEHLVIDTAAHLDAILAIDPEARTATVEPGVVQADLQTALAPHGLRFGPDPSTSSRCTIGGMIGNNACGPRALGYGRTSDNVVALEVLLATGEVVHLGPDASAASPVLDQLEALVAANLGTIRTQLGTFSRLGSGYALDWLLPEKRGNVAAFLAGTEGTLAIVLSATVRLVADAPVTQMVALGYPTMADAADAMAALTPFNPTAAEGLDRRIVDVVARAKGVDAVPPLPAGDGWVFVEFAGDDPTEVHGRASAALQAANPLEGWLVEDRAAAATLWQIRADGAGLAGVSLERPAWAGWEDASVPVEHLGDYLRAFDALLEQHGLHGLPYGHFGDGCVHCRIDFRFDEPDGTRRYQEFVEQAADLVARFGGSPSGEHGDGRARSALLPRVFSPEVMTLFGQVKRIFDPQNLLNPGVLVDPAPVAANVRVAQHLDSPIRRALPEFADAVHRCTGVGKCVSNRIASGQVMCPSYQATRNEKDSTRGRARVLQELVNGELVRDWRDAAVHESLDLCLSCKGCGRDCPTGTDMASLKSQVLDQSYRGRLRPRSHYTLGMLPRWTGLVSRVRWLPRLVNASLRVPPMAAVAKWVAGVDQRRPLPDFAPSRRRQPRPDAVTRAAPHTATPVVLWVDSFTDGLAGPGLDALVTVLTQAGYQPQVLERNACCGLTWITTGQLDGARAQLRKALDVLAPIAEAGTLIVGIEPSCTAVWRSDAPELLPDDPRVPQVAGAITTLAELLLSTPGWTPPDLAGTTIIAQPHCHHTAVLGWATDAELLARTGATVTTLGGCCGLAGNFGVEQGHFEVSVQVAENQLLPALDADPNAIVLADGFSCRKQVEDLRGRPCLTLAQVLAQ